MYSVNHSSSRTENLAYAHSTLYDPHTAANRFTSHTHDICELLLFKSGIASYTVEGKTYPLQKNSLVISRPACIHGIRIDGSEPYERYNLLYDPQKLLPELYEAIPKNIDVIHLDNTHTIVNLFQKMDLYYEQFQGAEYDRLLTLLTEEIFFNIRTVAQQMTEQGAVSTNPLIQQAISYIEENITTLESISDICNALFITKSHLHHLFIRHMQITPKKYILSKRLLLIQKAIHSGEKPTKAYLQYGFNNYTTFYRDYKNFFGYAPSDEIHSSELREFYF